MHPTLHQSLWEELKEPIKPEGFAGSLADNKIFDFFSVINVQTSFLHEETKNTWATSTSNWFLRNTQSFSMYSLLISFFTKQIYYIILQWMFKVWFLIKNNAFQRKPLHAHVLHVSIFFCTCSYTTCPPFYVLPLWPNCLSWFSKLGSQDKNAGVKWTFILCYSLWGSLNQLVHVAI